MMQHAFWGDLDPLNITGDASWWRALNRSWTPLGCVNDFISIVFENSLTRGTFLIIVELTNIS